MSSIVSGTRVAACRGVSLCRRAGDRSLYGCGWSVRAKFSKSVRMVLMDVEEKKKEGSQVRKRGLVLAC